MPKFISSGNGCRVRDVDGNEFIDFHCACGAILLGHAHPAVNDYVVKKLAKGVLFPLAGEFEFEAASEVLSLHKWADMVRFVKTGASANAFAIRLARAYTRRSHVIICAYHGWSDLFWPNLAGKSEFGIPSSAGIHATACEFGDMEQLASCCARHGEDLAAVLTTAWEGGDSPEFVSHVSDICRRYGALLILDEVTSGLRFNLGGFKQMWNIPADLVTMGKTLGNGFSVAAVIGTSAIMSLLEEGTVWASETCAGEVTGLAAAVATIRHLRNGEYYAKTAELGSQLAGGIKAIMRSADMPFVVRSSFPQAIELYALGNRSKEEDPYLLMALWQQLFNRNIFPSRFLHITEAMEQKDISQALDAFESAVTVLRRSYSFR